MTLPPQRRDGSPTVAPSPSRLAVPKKRSLTIAGHRTSITLEDAFWQGLKAIADEKAQPLASLVAEIDKTREAASLSAAIRVFVLLHFQEKAMGKTR